MRRRTRRRIIIILVCFLISIELIARVSFLTRSAPPHTAIAIEHAKIGLHYTGNYWLSDDFSGEYFNVSYGERRTVGQPAHPQANVWLLGNSTLFDVFNADADTIASQLQKSANAAGYRWRFVNLGATGQTAAGELALLHDTPIARGDTVVFLDGIIDADLMLVCNPDIYPLAIVRIMCDDVNYLPFTNSSTIANHYWQTIDRARDYAQRHGAAFYHFLQPIGYDNGHYQTIRGDRTSIMIPFGDFLDGYHVNAHGSAHIARAMWDAISTF